MFKSIEDLPDSLRRVMPVEAQELYRAAYNRVAEKATMATAKPEQDVARAAREAALLAVQAEFRRDENGRWHRQPVGEQLQGKEPEEGR